MNLTETERLAAIERAARRHETDETPGDSLERIETVLYYASNGVLGRDWGQAYKDEEDEPRTCGYCGERIAFTRTSLLGEPRWMSSAPDFTLVPTCTSNMIPGAHVPRKIE